MTKIIAPFTPAQVTALQFYQDEAPFHPFTCGNRDDHPELHGDKGVLVPTVRGWVCQFCDYTQNWAHDFMADKPAMEASLAARRALFAGPHDHD